MVIAASSPLIPRAWQDGLGVASAVLGILGSLYLSYDLLGRPGGLLRRMTRGITLGLTIALSTALLAYLVQPALCLALGCSPQRVVSLVVTLLAGLIGAMFGLVVPVSLEGQDKPPPVFHPYSFRLSALAGILIGLSIVLGEFIQQFGAGADFLASLRAAGVALTWALVLLGTTMVYGGTFPYLFWQADHLPERRLGAIGLGFITVAFLLQLVPPIVDWWALVNP